jgi:hypothetical protein
MAYSRDMERIARQFLRQKLDLEYIRHYLMETYQAGPELIAQIFQRIGAAGFAADDGNPMAAVKPKARDSEASQKQRSRASKFFN